MELEEKMGSKQKMEPKQKIKTKKIKMTSPRPKNAKLTTRIILMIWLPKSYLTQLGDVSTSALGLQREV